MTRLRVDQSRYFHACPKTTKYFLPEFIRPKTHQYGSAISILGQLGHVCRPYTRCNFIKHFNTNHTKYANKNIINYNVEYYVPPTYLRRIYDNNIFYITLPYVNTVYEKDLNRPFQNGCVHTYIPVQMYTAACTHVHSRAAVYYCMYTHTFPCSCILLHVHSNQLLLGEDENIPIFTYELNSHWQCKYWNASPKSSIHL